MDESGKKEGIGSTIWNFFWFLRRKKLSEKKQEEGQAPVPAEAEPAAEKVHDAALPAAAEGKAGELRKKIAAARPKAEDAKLQISAEEKKQAAKQATTEKKKIEKELKVWRVKVEELTKKVEGLENQLKANMISPNQAVNKVQIVYGEVDREENSINREIRATKAVMKGTVFDYYKRRMTLDDFRKRMLEYRGRLRVLQVEKSELKKEGSKIKEIGGSVREFAMQMPASAVMVPGGGEGLEAVFGGGGGARGGRGRVRAIISGSTMEGTESGAGSIVVESGAASGGGAAEGGTPSGGGRGGGGIGAVLGGIASGAASVLKGGKGRGSNVGAIAAGAARAEKEAQAGAAGGTTAGKVTPETRGVRSWAQNISIGQGGAEGGTAKPALPKLPKGEKGAGGQGAAGGGAASGEKFDRDALEERWGKGAGVEKILGAGGQGGTDSERLAELEKKINELLKEHKISESGLEEHARELDTSKIIENFNKLIDLVELEKRAKNVGVPQTEMGSAEVSAVGMGSPKKIEAIKGIAIELKKHRIVTDFDRVLSLVKERKKVGMLEIAATLGIDKKWAEECCEILEQSGLITVAYPAFGKVEVKLAGYVEAKPVKKGKLFGMGGK